MWQPLFITVVKNLKIAVMLLLEIALAIRLFNNYYHESFFTGIITLFILILTAGSFLVILILDIARFYRWQQWAAFRSTFISLFAVIPLAAPVIYMNAKKDSSVVLYCKTMPADTCDMAIRFKENGTYEIITQGLGAVFSRGNYRKHDDLIVLEKNPIDTLIVSPYLVNDKNVIIYQADARKQRIAGATAFVIRDL
jgi:hypothetical protein